MTSDHGFSTHTGGFDLPALVKPFVRTMADGTPDIVVAGGAVHFRAPDDARVDRRGGGAAAHPAVGAIFTRGDAGPAGHVGTLSFEGIGWAHPPGGRDPGVGRLVRGRRARTARAVHRRRAAPATAAPARTR